MIGNGLQNRFSRRFAFYRCREDVAHDYARVHVPGLRLKMNFECHFIFTNLL